MLLLLSSGCFRSKENTRKTKLGTQNSERQFYYDPGRFFFNQKFGFTFSVVNDTASSTIYGKEDNLGSYTQIFENLLKGTLFHLIFIPEIVG